MSGQPEHTYGASGDGRSQLREYLAVLWLRKWTIVILAILVLGGALFYSFSQVPLYRASVRILMQPTGSTTTGIPAGAASSTINLQTEAELVRSPAVAERVADELSLPPQPGALQRGLSVTIEPESQIMVVGYVSPKPIEAQQRAKLFADAYLEHRREQLLEEIAQQKQAIQRQLAPVNRQIASFEEELAGLGADDPERTSVQAQVNPLYGQRTLFEQQLRALSPAAAPTVGQVIEPALLPSSPVSPNHVRTGAVAAVAGLLLGVAAAFLRERLDDRLRGRGDLERYLGAPVLAVIPNVSQWKRRGDTPLITSLEPRSAVSEAYRTLRTSLLFSAGERGAKTILVTSGHAEEGKTATVANLGVSLAQAGKRVILVSADLRKPRLHRFFDTGLGEGGLTSILSGEIKPWVGVVNVGHENLRLAPSGTVPGNPAELLGSDAMGRLLDQFREIADLVIIDSAPVLVVADALALAPFVDAVLYVADAESTRRGAVVHARQQLEQVNAPVMGAVLNNFDPTKGKKGYGYYYYGYYYRPYEYEQPGKGRRRRRRGQEEPSGFEPTQPVAAPKGGEPMWTEPARGPVAPEPQPASEPAPAPESPPPGEEPWVGTQPRPTSRSAGEPTSPGARPEVAEEIPSEATWNGPLVPEEPERAADRGAVRDDRDEDAPTPRDHGGAQTVRWE